ncbi:MAG: SiaC family regulatory phosphoprotein [Bacteroides sp.]
MISYYVVQGNDYPLLDFDIKSKEFTICGISHPESAMEFYGSLIRWLKEYIDWFSTQTTNKEVVHHRLNLLFRHINSMSFRSVSRICRLFSTLSTYGSCEIVWLFENEDIDIYEAGVDLKEELALEDTLFRIEETSETIESLQERLIAKQLHSK